ncbi:MAG: DarT ssDNA thymidine ADP-ribosyltransferase family protein, partial [Desulfuromonadaceae bacterium]
MTRRRINIPEVYAQRSVYHFTHIENLPMILEHGLLSTNEKVTRGIDHQVIAYNGIQCRRAEMEITCAPGGLVHDYVPLYFCIRSPMLNAVISNKIADEQFIVYLEFPISIMSRYNCVFTDASANTAAAPNFYSDPVQLDQIDWEAVATWKWAGKYDVDFQQPVRQRKMAELLVHSQLPICEVSRVVVWNESIRDSVFSMFDEYEITRPSVILGGKEYYFFDRGGRLPPVTGPFFIKQKYDRTITGVIESERPGNTRYKTLISLHDALHESLEALPETAELVGLGTENPMHGQSVGEHTLSVLNGLMALPEYEGLSQGDRVLVELAAYLHDIGKGPRSRWPGGRQQVDADHPLKALPMLKRILTEEVERVQGRSIKILCKLVCYHDIIGGIIGQGRRPEELEGIIETEQELAMLIALCKADIRAVNLGWCD